MCIMVKVDIGGHTLTYIRSTTVKVESNQIGRIHCLMKRDGGWGVYFNCEGLQQIERRGSSADNIGRRHCLIERDGGGPFISISKIGNK